MSKYNSGQVAVEYILMIMVVSSVVIFLFKQFSQYIYVEDCADNPQAVYCQLLQTFKVSSQNSFKRYPM